MKLACIDLEGVLVPELWPAIAAHTGIDALTVTTRDVPDYGALMRTRIEILRDNGLTLAEVTRIIDSVAPFADARAFLEDLSQAGYEVNIISDCFHELADPLLEVLGRPTTMCHRLIVDVSGFITGCDFYKRQGKEDHVAQALAQGFEVLAVGDALNDVGMLRLASQGFLVNPSVTTRQAAPGIRAVSGVSEILGFLAA
ncbi:bifunctional phosphoserine phosphatase/homoserine phosphotransferase ThrH [Pseudomonas gingeri]|uniref:bifunctional phosphoserine phosphatase/homoserine phosphotransferase ThrH n=1 Tax=Pseudomonas gingeri TaxID=117681 RepID=UPI0015A4452F|nr:bifunctional phosphoserine phosphatase/homoserine phosphotransferase ThrH [Pseudomonas gingeri]NWD75708.1 bifunctional phosphoserine phosphatase/homoserine phosphotransferase ThrH [Pseudomonas gingeri]